MLRPTVFWTERVEVLILMQWLNALGCSAVFWTERVEDQTLVRNLLSLPSVWGRWAQRLVWEGAGEGGGGD